MKSVFEGDGIGYPHNLHFAMIQKMYFGGPIPVTKITKLSVKFLIGIRMSFPSYAYFFYVVSSTSNSNENHWQKNIAIKNSNK